MNDQGLTRDLCLKSNGCHTYYQPTRRFEKGYIQFVAVVARPSDLDQLAKPLGMFHPRLWVFVICKELCLCENLPSRVNRLPRLPRTCTAKPRHRRHVKIGFLMGIPEISGVYAMLLHKLTWRIQPFARSERLCQYGAPQRT